MAWTWTFEKADGTAIGSSEEFDNRSDAETWVGENFGELITEGVDQVRLREGEREVYGPMGLHAE
ncbi:MAG: hypothetical protein JWP10_1075 [Nocardioidaceae bacterium]|nr:hypothetical protein [Nocardioidaceae bacterium]